MLNAYKKKFPKNVTLKSKIREGGGISFPGRRSVNFFLPDRRRHTILFKVMLLTDHVPVEKVNYDCAAGKFFIINRVPKAGLFF